MLMPVVMLFPLRRKGYIVYSFAQVVRAPIQIVISDILRNKGQFTVNMMPLEGGRNSYIQSAITRHGVARAEAVTFVGAEIINTAQDAIGKLIDGENRGGMCGSRISQFLRRDVGVLAIDLSVGMRNN